MKTSLRTLIFTSFVLLQSVFAITLENTSSNTILYRLTNISKSELCGAKLAATKVQPVHLKKLPAHQSVTLNVNTTNSSQLLCLTIPALGLSKPFPYQSFTNPACHIRFVNDATNNTAHFLLGPHCASTQKSRGL